MKGFLVTYILFDFMIFTKINETWFIGCPYPDSCIPQNYKVNEDQDCFSNCPVTCGINEMQCSGGVDHYTGDQ